MIVYLVPDFIILSLLIKSTYFNFKLKCTDFIGQQAEGVVGLCFFPSYPQKAGSVLHLLVCLCIAYTVHNICW